MDNTLYYILAVFVASLSTALTRFLPFFLLRDKADNPFLKYLEETMPLLIMTILVFFTLKDIPWGKTYGICEIGGIACSILCFLLSKNSIFIIFSGGIFYLVVIRFF